MNITLDKQEAILLFLYCGDDRNDTIRNLREMQTHLHADEQDLRQMADRISAGTGKTVKVIDIRLLLFSPIDLRGVPMADESREFTRWLRPKLFDLDSSEDTINILFLDELSAAPQSIQAAAYQITLDRTVGEHKLPDNTIVMAAGNRTTDRSVAFRIPNALANRMMHFQIDVDFASWRSWAIRNKIHPLIIGYLSFDHSKLYCEPTESGIVAYPTPRTWAFLSNLLYSIMPLLCYNRYRYYNAVFCLCKDIDGGFFKWYNFDKIQKIY